MKTHPQHARYLSASPVVGPDANSVRRLLRTAFLAAAVAAGLSSAQAATETVLHSFRGSFVNGNGPNANGGVVRDSAGNLYGMTQYGGKAGAGVVFKLDTKGHETVLHNFTGGADGGSPQGGLINDTAGNLYGVTSEGGNAGAGVVFKNGQQRE